VEDVDPPFCIGYTSGMKTAISLPDTVFEQVEKLARRTKRSRSELYTLALKEYLARHATEEITETMNAVVDRLDTKQDDFTTRAAAEVLEQSEW
jgi:metal-responsive CopG/Arc/MetJ family transcriptional regulator